MDSFGLEKEKEEKGCGTVRTVRIKGWSGASASTSAYLLPRTMILGKNNWNNRKEITEIYGTPLKKQFNVSVEVKGRKETS